MTRATGRRRARIAALVAAVSLLALLTVAEPAVVGFAGAGAAAPAAPRPLVAPRPTSRAASPDSPDPHPPAGGRAPDGSVPGGDRLAGRGVIVPPHAPRLPAGLTAAAWVLVDLDAGTVLAARDPHGRYQPASILKTLTAVTLLPSLPGSRLVPISAKAAGTEGSAVGLLAGARYTVDQLFRALLLVSANDAATALAEAAGGVPLTVGRMNAEARALGGYDTLVQTPSGLDGWQQLTSAYDMALFLRAAVDSGRFVHYDRTPSATFPPKASGHGAVGAYQFENQSLNFLQAYRGALVAKTGYTDAALHTYVCAAQQGGRRLGVVFLRNQRAPLDQYQQAGRLLNWGFALPAGTTPVGTLGTSGDPGGQAPAGDPVASSGAPAPSGVAPSGVEGAASAVSSPHPRPTATAAPRDWSLASTESPFGVSVTAVALVGVAACGAGVLRARRRRTPRRS